MNRVDDLSNPETKLKELLPIVREQWAAEQRDRAERIARGEQDPDLDADGTPLARDGESVGEFVARVDFDTSVGAVLREARELARVGVRELGRRAGVEASRLSRIESGRTAQPDEEVLQRLAHALGRMPQPLLFLARGGTMEEVNWIDSSYDELYEILGHTDKAERNIARLIFLNNSPLEDLVESVGPGMADGLEEVVGSWAALTPERRTLLRAFVADQVELSERDRKAGSAPFEIRLTGEETDR